MEPVSGEPRAAGRVAGAGRDRAGLAGAGGQFLPRPWSWPLGPSVGPQADGILRPRRCSARWGQSGIERRSKGVRFQGHSTPGSG